MQNSFLLVSIFQQYCQSGKAKMEIHFERVTSEEFIWKCRDTRLLVIICSRNNLCSNSLFLFDYSRIGYLPIDILTTYHNIGI